MKTCGRCEVIITDHERVCRRCRRSGFTRILGFSAWLAAGACTLGAAANMIGAFATLKSGVSPGHTPGFNALLLMVLAVILFFGLQSLADALDGPEAPENDSSDGEE